MQLCPRTRIFVAAETGLVGDSVSLGLEGCFAQGHVYVLVSRVTDPANLALVGLPPHMSHFVFCLDILRDGQDILDI